MTNIPVTPGQAKRARLAIRDLCELFGGAKEVVELHLVAGERAEAVIWLRNDEGRQYLVDGEIATGTVYSEFVCSHALGS